MGMWPALPRLGLLIFDVGATELLLVAVLAVMLYGGDLPDVARRAGGTMKRLRGVADDLKRQVTTVPPELEMKDVKAELRKIPHELGTLRRDISVLPPPPSAAPPPPAPSADEPASPPPAPPTETPPPAPPAG